MDPSHRKGSPSQPQSHSADHNHQNSSNIDDSPHHRVRFAEEVPELSQKKIHHPVPVRRAAPSAKAEPAATPAVYWDDRETDANFEQYTFYREGTPTPPEDEGHEKVLGHGAPVAEGSAASGGVGGSDRDFNLGPRGNGEAGNWSLGGSTDLSTVTRKRAFWGMVVAGVVVLIGIAVGVGVGLGVGLSKGQGGQPGEEPSRSVEAHEPFSPLLASPSSSGN